MNNATAHYSIVGMQMTFGSNYMPKSGGRGQYSPRERRVSLARFVTPQSRRVFPVATGDVPSPPDL